ncbi:hypothetical protein F5880DRAFT_1512736, partial [Lentinula raphanica]
TSSRVVQLQGEVKGLKENMETLQKQKTELDQKVLQLNQDKQDLQRKNSVNIRINIPEVGVMLMPFKEITTTMTIKSNELSKLEATASTLQKQVESDKRELGDLRAFKSTVDGSESLREKVKTLSSDCQIQRKTIENQKEQIRILHLETVAKIRFDGLDADYKLLKDKVSSKIAEIKELKAKVNFSLSLKGNLLNVSKIANTPNQAEVETLKTNGQTLQSSLDAERSHVSNLRAEVEQLKQERDLYKSSRDQNAQQSFENLRKQYDQQLSNNIQHQNQIKELQQAISNLTSERDALKSSAPAEAQAMEIASLRQQITRLETERDQLK